MRLKTLKSYFEDVSKYLTGNVDPLEFHKSLYLFFKLSGLTDDPVPKWMTFIPILVCFNAITIGSLFIPGMCYGLYIFDIPLFTENGTYFIVMVYKLLIFYCTRTDKKRFQNLLKVMKDDFEYVCNVDSKYRYRFMQNQLFSRKLCVMILMTTCFIAIFIVMCADLALVYHVITHDSKDGSPRPLPFPFWIFDTDLTKSPYYDIILLLSNSAVITHLFIYTLMVKTQIVWVRQITSKADIIIWSIEGLLIDIHPTNDLKLKAYFEELIKKRLKIIVEMYFDMNSLLDEYTAVYRKILMFAQKLLAPVICLTAYSAAEKLDNGDFQFILVMLCVGAVLFEAIPNYTCTFLTEKISSIGDACWNTPFWNAPPAIRPYFVLIMQRSVRPIPFQAAGFDPVSLETFSKKLTSAYSAFNMLRQANFN